MRLLCAAVLLMLPLSGCSLLGMSGRELRPELIVLGQPLRAAMLNPEPPLYGDGNPGGCMVWSEFRVVITELVMDAAGELRIRGFVSRTEGIPLPDVTIAQMRGDTSVATAHSGPTGGFEITTQPGDAARLVVSRTFYRPLELDLARLARAATPASPS